MKIKAFKMIIFFLLVTLFLQNITFSATDQISYGTCSLTNVKFGMLIILSIVSFLLVNQRFAHLVNDYTTETTWTYNQENSVQGSYTDLKDVYHKGHAEYFFTRGY